MRCVFCVPRWHTQHRIKKHTVPTMDGVQPIINTILLNENELALGKMDPFLLSVKSVAES